MVVGKGVVDGHVHKEWQDMRREESLNLAVVVLGVDEEGTKVGFHNVR